MAVPSFLADISRKTPQKIAIVAEGRNVSYFQLDTLVNRFANGLLGLGVRRGDLVATFLPNSLEFIVSYYAVLRIGASFVPMNPMLKSGEIEHILRDTKARAVVVDAPRTDLVAAVRPRLSNLGHVIQTGADAAPGHVSYWQLVDRAEGTFRALDAAPDDVAVVAYTAGTTGLPKGATLTHSNVESVCRLYIQSVRLDEKDVSLVTTPLSHVQAQNCLMNAPIFTGGTTVLMDRWTTAEQLETIQKYRVTILLMVPTLLSYILNYPQVKKYDLSSVRCTMSGGAPLPVAVAEDFKKLTNAPVVEGYGLTECQSIAIGTPFGRIKLGSAGQPPPGVSVRIVDESDRDVPRNEVGELIVQSPCLMKGYLNKPEATREAMRGGWFHTKDLARMDEDGYIYITGRKDDMIITSGFNIYPLEVENVIYQHPKVAEAALVGVPDEVKGQLAKAFVVLKPDETATEKEIIDFCKERIAAYKAPRLVQFVGKLPKSSVGKILKRELKGK